MKRKTWLIIAAMLALMLVPIFSATASEKISEMTEMTEIYHLDQGLSSAQGDVERTSFSSITLLQSVMAAGGGAIGQSDGVPARLQGKCLWACDG